MKKIMILTHFPSRKVQGLKGITLMESLLAVGIIVLAFSLVTSAYKKFTLQRNAAKIQNSVVLLGKALEQYYNVNCYWFLADPNSYNAGYSIPVSTNPNIIPQPTSGNPSPALSAYIATPQAIGNPYGTTTMGAAAYTYTIDVQGDFPVLSINTTFASTTSTDILSTLQSILKPDVVNGNTFTWYTASHYSLDAQNTSLNTNLNYLQALTPVYTNPTNTSLPNQYQNAGQEYTNVCTYWQTPSVRCKVTGVSTRCTYQNIGS
ncbi:MAG: hypothetical protein K0R48_728 [Gammaproteobacteria bacterium]|jgi:type II secretory pathway pseudopilin PulG|nr:hypothetical protein [Gammaproteobacteria bacterium]